MSQKRIGFPADVSCVYYLSFTRNMMQQGWLSLVALTINGFCAGHTRVSVRFLRDCRSWCCPSGQSLVLVRLA